MSQKVGCCSMLHQTSFVLPPGSVCPSWWLQKKCYYINQSVLMPLMELWWKWKWKLKMRHEVQNKLMSSNIFIREEEHSQLCHLCWGESCWDNVFVRTRVSLCSLERRLASVVNRKWKFIENVKLKISLLLSKVHTAFSVSSFCSSCVLCWGMSLASRCSCV